MGESGSAWPRLTLAVLVIALAAASAYIVQLRGRVAEHEQRAAAPARVAADTAQTPGSQTPGAAPVGRVLTAAQLLAMHDALSAAPGTKRTAWFQVQANNPDTAPVLAALTQVFEQAGWTTATVRGPYPLKSGIFLLAADEPPAPSADVVNQAFSAAGIDVQYLTGYRAFYLDRKNTNPNWVGPELADDQAFVIVIGSRPTTPKPQ